MKKVIFNLILTIFLVTSFPLFTAFEISKTPVDPTEQALVKEPDPALKKAAFSILKSKCNSCHKKKNPFKIFSLKNMDKHAPKIYKQVFVYERMPKGNQVKLTDEEYQTLKKWLKSKNIF